MVTIGFLPQNFGGGGDLRMMVLLTNECSLSRGTIIGGWDTLPLRWLGWKKFAHKPSHPSTHANEPPGETFQMKH